MHAFWSQLDYVFLIAGIVSLIQTTISTPPVATIKTVRNKQIVKILTTDFDYFSIKDVLIDIGN